MYCFLAICIKVKYKLLMQHAIFNSHEYIFLDKVENTIIKMQTFGASVKSCVNEFMSLMQ